MKTFVVLTVICLVSACASDTAEIAKTCSKPNGLYRVKLELSGGCGNGSEETTVAFDNGEAVQDDGNTVCFEDYVDASGDECSADIAVTCERYDSGYLVSIMKLIGTRSQFEDGSMEIDAAMTYETVNGTCYGDAHYTYTKM